MSSVLQHQQRSAAVIASRSIPLILHLATASQAGPIGAFVWSRQRTRAARMVAIGAFISLLANGVGRLLAATLGNNQIVSYLSTPVTAACFFWALADWQVTAQERRVVRFATPGFLAIWTLLVLLFEDVRNFDVISYPLYSLTLTAISLWTLLRRSQAVEIVPYTRTDWFWISVGLATLGVSTLLTTPIGGVLLARERYDLFDLVWQTRSWLVALSYCLMTWGIYRGPMVSKFSTIGTIAP